MLGILLASELKDECLLIEKIDNEDYYICDSFLRWGIRLTGQQFNQFVYTYNGLQDKVNNWIPIELLNYNLPIRNLGIVGKDSYRPVLASLSVENKIKNIDNEPSRLNIDDYLKYDELILCKSGEGLIGIKEEFEFILQKYIIDMCYMQYIDNGLEGRSRKEELKGNLYKDGVLMGWVDLIKYDDERIKQACDSIVKFLECQTKAEIRRNKLK